jgi:hypothetical protein
LRAKDSALSFVLEQTARISHVVPRILLRAWAWRSAAKRAPMKPMPIVSMAALLLEAGEISVSRVSRRD